MNLKLIIRISGIVFLLASLAWLGSTYGWILPIGLIVCLWSYYLTTIKL